jgi:hypothetical protein
LIRSSCDVRSLLEVRPLFDDSVQSTRFSGDAATPCAAVTVESRELVRAREARHPGNLRPRFARVNRNHSATSSQARSSRSKSYEPSRLWRGNTYADAQRVLTKLPLVELTEPIRDARRYSTRPPCDRSRRSTSQPPPPSPTNWTASSPMTPVSPPPPRLTASTCSHLPKQDPHDSLLVRERARARLMC